MDDDLADLSREQLVEEIHASFAKEFASTATAPVKSCAGIIPASGDSSQSGRTRCPRCPIGLSSSRGCIRYRQSLDEQLPEAPRSAQLTR